MDRIIHDWPGKSGRDGGPEHPAVYHMIDVAAVAERLLAPCPLAQPLRDALVLLIALHDLGKIGDGFRDMIRKRVPQSWRHWQLTEVWLAENESFAARLQADSHALKHLIAAIAGHHGRPSEKPTGDFKRQRRFARPEVAQDVAAVIAGFCDLWPDASLAALSEEQAGPLGWWLAGLTTGADWAGSNAEWFPARQGGLTLADYLAHARGLAAKAVPKAGLVPGQLKTAPLFDFPLRPMQQAARDIALPDGPTLAFIEDETGAGKTEAALILAQRMLEAHKGKGVYLALPTMATSDAMFARIRAIAPRLFDRPSLTLAHGRAHLSDQFRDLIGQDSRSDDATCAPWLADNRRRALLADIGIGTVDQALLSVVRARFSALRLWGLSSKILIVDEAHEISGDSYMASLLKKLLQVHAAQAVRPFC
ncbi:MAG: CRISPR-associated endonuclease Cas3'' [Rhodobacteraceae bacterium]|nr:CRISPR-associated endonuclease Cas3'' [Paracoccaceae bacterium]